MEQLRFRVFDPSPPLRAYISRLWVLEGRYGADSQAFKHISPNGMLKMILIYRGQVRSGIESQSTVHRESSLAVVGQTVDPAIVDPVGEFGTIGIEFHPAGIYRLFPFALSELTNRFHDGDDVFGREGRELRERAAEVDSVEEKIRAIETFLLRKLANAGRENRVTEYAATRIVNANGLLRIEELCRDTGYSRRHLTRLFHEHVGIGPKELARISRFQAIYQRISTGRLTDMDELYDFYYDQSHFAKEFRRLTGMTPRQFAERQVLGKVFYRA